MDQTSQSPPPVIGVVTGASQLPYTAPTYPPAAIVAGAPAAMGTIPATDPTYFSPNNAPLAGQHQLAYQQFHQQQQQHQHQQLQAFWEEQMSEIEKTTDFKNHSLPLARIKKIMKADEDVRMISAEAPVVFAKACEIFILELTLRAWIHTEENKRRTLQKNDIAAAISRTDIYDFLVDIVPREELKDESLGMARAAGLPAIGAPADSIPYYYVPMQPGMIMGKPVDQGTAAAAAVAMYANQQPPSATYMWPQAQSQPPHQQLQQEEVPDNSD